MGARVRSAEIVERADDLQGGEDAERAVELAARGLAVEVAADEDGRGGRVLARAPGEHVAHGIDAHGEAGRLAQRAEPVPALPVHLA